MKLRQLPQLYLRGSIANETMRYMTKEEVDNVNRLTQEISKMPILAGHKYHFTEKLSQTIGGDYYKNKQAAEQEFDIAIWRALVYLLYHSDYNYACDACQSTEYLTEKCKMRPLDRRYPICPACGNVKITDAGDSEYTVGQFVNMDDLQKAILRLGNNAKQPQHTSAISPIRGKKKIENHEEILNDPNQIVKYFGEFCWNYFRQTLRENEIKYHSKKPHDVCGPADKVAVDEINSMLTRMKVSYTYNQRANPIDGKYVINVELLATHQTVSRALRVIIDKYEKHGVTIDTTNMEVAVTVMTNAPTVTAKIVTPKLVCIQGHGSSDEDGEMSVYDAYQQHIHTGVVGGSSMQEDGIAQIESNDLVTTIRDSLNDDAQKVYDIIIGQGENYDGFVAYQHGPRGAKSNAYCEKPRFSHIAKYLGISQKQFGSLIDDIKLQCLAHDVGI